MTTVVGFVGLSGAGSTPLSRVVSDELEPDCLSVRGSTRAVVDRLEDLGSI